MSLKDVNDSKHKFARAKPEPPVKPKATFIEGVNVATEKVPQKAVELLYKIGGGLTEDDKEAMAKRVIHPNQRREFFVKFATAGAGSGRMLNPWGPYYNHGDELKYEKTMGRKRYEFRKVVENVFNSYVQFLETRNERHLLHAEREANNG